LKLYVNHKARIHHKLVSLYSAHELISIEMVQFFIVNNSFKSDGTFHSCVFICSEDILTWSFFMSY